MTSLPTDVVVVTMGTSTPVAAVHAAADEAAGRGATLQLLMAYDGSLAVAKPGSPDLFHLARATATAVLASVRATLAVTHPALRVVTVLRFAMAHHALMRSTERPLITVAGNHRVAGWATTLFVSMAANLMAGGQRSPAIVARRTSAGGRRNSDPVWVGLDGSAECNHAFALAVESASAQHVPSVGIHSWNEQQSGVPLTGPSFDIDRQRRERDRELFKEELGGWSERHRDVQLMTLVLRGRPTESTGRPSRKTPLVNQSALVVVGSRGGSGLTNVLLHSARQASITSPGTRIAAAASGDEE